MTSNRGDMTELSDTPTIDLLTELDRRAKLDDPPEVEFYGVWPGQRSGHYLRDKHGNQLWDVEREFAGKYGRSLYPWSTAYDARRRHEFSGPQDEGKLWHWHHPTEAITLLLSWDRSADKRGNCCASFIVRAHVTPERALDLARSTFPKVFERIEAHLGRATELAGPVPT